MQKLARNRVRKLEVAALAEGPARARILAVDDDERNLLAISEVLATIGEVICAQSGEEALRFPERGVRRHSPGCPHARVGRV